MADKEPSSSTEAIRNARRWVVDPETGMNIADLGRAHGIELTVDVVFAPVAIADGAGLFRQAASAAAGLRNTVG